MFFPAFPVIARVPGTSLTDETVTLPKVVMESLLRIAFAGTNFDDAFYRSKYPDVVKAIEAGTVTGEFDHFVRFGYYEGRQPRQYNVDATWYADHYQDVGAAIRTGMVKDPESHFNVNGIKEPRAPTPTDASRLADLLKAAGG
jgi:hypothetical protein